MEHIDRKSLYTSLEARIDYLHKFLDFNDRDLEALAFGSKFVQDLIPAVTHVVYRKLLQFDITARAFEVRDTRSEEPLNSVLDDNSPEVQKRKSFLNSYLKKICSDQSTMAFWEYLDNVGNKPLRVEYIHISATLCLIQHVLTESILSHNALPMSRRVAMVKALSKVIWIQNDLFAKWCVRDGDEFTGGPTALAEHQASTTEVPLKALGASTCPFSGVTNGMQGLKVGE
ncbi:globin-like-protein [Fusarium albosuccineum]|uniref:Globin-like-protein n=1 Tax=Fusarium albosuccineum TaxID=1237068 RepID=A0A8H4P8I3_9HYPO|nr:globin-like-protein [Fusarium albosuccineum]